MPSYLKRKSQGGGGKAKKVKAIQTWDRDIICLPMSSKKSGSNISYPRGKFRTDLGSLGLIGKVHLTSMMSEEDPVGCRNINGKFGCAVFDQLQAIGKTKEEKVLEMMQLTSILH